MKQRKHSVLDIALEGIKYCFKRKKLNNK